MVATKADLERLGLHGIEWTVLRDHMAEMSVDSGSRMLGESLDAGTMLPDKIHLVRHRGEALDKLRKAEYARLSGKGGQIEIHIIGWRESRAPESCFERRSRNSTGSSTPASRTVSLSP